ncbi:FG-GAP repeat domain-containing protein [Streptomyces sp. NPDC001410]|uniref:FG-GAP repeat domain-containing protein n=1 Tax=Streptomyces sp. NPDC001410 TaxID=3364574 RepID=UPI0036986C34
MRGDDIPERKNAFGDAPSAEAARRHRWLVGCSIAVIVAVGVGWHAWPASQEPSTDPHVRNPGKEQPICASSDGRTLYADVDGDGVVDEVHDSKDRDGRTVVMFEGPGNKQVRHFVWSIVTTAEGRAKAHASPAEGFRAAFGDFDNDGRVDMAVTYTARDEGDDPVDSVSMHEVRWGPLGRDLKGKSRGSIRMRHGYYIDGLRAVAGNQHSASANPASARLLIHQTTGDGAFETYQGQKLGHDLVVPDEPLPRWGQEFAEQKDGWTDLGECPASPRSTATGPQ